MLESVFYFIFDWVGSMYFDKDNNIWIKKKEGYVELVLVMLFLDDSEDDLFVSILDFIVDMIKEM